ncbi:MAG: energy transducer TonB [Polyangiaceae bacterium]|nr:energy transducer TonB [Polyangiaceae bacterium]
MIEFEAPYKLGQAPAPRGQAEAAELERWNRGGRGDPPAPPPPSEGHPLPRVIVDVTGVKGPLRAAEVQRIARQRLWIEVVQCYRLGAYRDQSLRGKVTVRLTAGRAGKVTAAKVTASTMPDKEVSGCLANATKRLALPRARAGSTITAMLQVSPGDDPVEPPPGAIVPGDGSLAPAAITSAAAAAMPAWRSCYEQGLAGAPELWGRIAVRFHVTADGRADEAFEAGSSFPDERVARCVLRAARALTFPAPEGGDLRFVLPIRLSPRDPSRDEQR